MDYKRRCEKCSLSKNGVEDWSKHPREFRKHREDIQAEQLHRAAALRTRTAARERAEREAAAAAPPDPGPFEFGGGFDDEGLDRDDLGGPRARRARAQTDDESGDDAFVVQGAGGLAYDDDHDDDDFEYVDVDGDGDAGAPPGARARGGAGAAAGLPASRLRWRARLRPEPAVRVRHPLAPPLLEDEAERHAPRDPPSDNPLVRLAVYAIAFIHVQWRLPRRPAQFLHYFVLLLFTMIASLLPLDFDPNSPLVTAATHFPTSLDLLLWAVRREPRTLAYPLCPNPRCRSIFPLPTAAHPLPDICPGFVKPPQKTGSTRLVVCTTPLTRPRRRARVPCETVPLRSMRDWIGELLARPGVEERLERPLHEFQTPGTRMRDIYDGRLVREFPGAAQHGSGLFFAKSRRLAISIYYDGISMRRSKTGNQYSAGLVFATMNNLPREQRYRFENVGFLAILPGPTEFPQAALNSILQIFVEEAKDLWTGVDLPSFRPPAPPVNGDRAPQAPQQQARTQRWHGVVLNVLGDRPALVKLIGATPHTATSFCHLDDATMASTRSNASVLDRNERTMRYDLDNLIARTGEERLTAMRRWEATDNAKERKAIELEWGTTYSPFEQLPYVDLAALGATDFSHTAYLGIPRWHQLQLHIRTNILDESPTALPYLRLLLSRFRTPSNIGRLPKNFGAAGSSALKADEWRAWTEVLSSVVLLGVFVEGPSAEDLEELRKAPPPPPPKRARVAAKKAAPGKGKGRARSATPATAAGDAASNGGLDDDGDVEMADVEAGEEAPHERAGRKAFEERWKRRLLTAGPDERRELRTRSWRAWIVFVEGARLAFKRSTTVAEADEATRLFGEYARAVRELFGADSTAPNNHFLLHHGYFADLFGPVYSTWTFPHERVNGLVVRALNNGKPNEAEHTLMRAYWDNVDLAVLRSATSRSPATSPVEHDLFDRADAVVLRRAAGTVDVDYLGSAEIPLPVLDGLRAVDSIDEVAYECLLKYLNSPYAHFSSGYTFIRNTDPTSSRDRVPLPATQSLYTSARFPSFTVSTPPPPTAAHDDSLVLARYHDDENPSGIPLIGRVLALVDLHIPTGATSQLGAKLAFVRWHRGVDLDALGSEEASRLERGGFGTWFVEPDEYYELDAGSFIPLSHIVAPVASLPLCIKGHTVLGAVAIQRD